MAVKFSKIIRDLRTQLGLSQVEFGKRVGIHPVTIARWETDRITASFASVKQIADKLGMNVVELIAEEGESLESVVTRVPELVSEIGKPEDVKRMAETFSLPDKDVRRIVKGVVSAMQTTQSTKVTKEHATVTAAPESLHQWLGPVEALLLLKDVNLRMKDLPAESALWMPLQRLSQELGRLSGLEDRPIRPLALQPGADSAGAKTPVAVTAL